jgi:hypothetical protein
VTLNDKKRHDSGRFFAKKWFEILDLLPVHDGSQDMAEGG